MAKTFTVRLSIKSNGEMHLFRIEEKITFTGSISFMFAERKFHVLLGYH